MYLARLVISNFRKLKEIELKFQPGLNVLIGPNNIGKTAIVDALRALLAGYDDPYPRFDINDIHCPKEGEPVGDITFKYIFSGLNEDDEADFIPALQIDGNGVAEVHITVCYYDPDKIGRLRVKRWCGEHEDVGLTSEMMENLRGVYLQPLRDASKSLKPGKTSQLARLFHLLADDASKEAINEVLKKVDEDLKKQSPLVNTNDAISGRHGSMLGEQMAQQLTLGLNGSDFQKLASRLSLIIDKFDIEQNGLGFNNLIFMAVVLSELAKNPDSSYRGLIVEEPEAHLHPQLQAILLGYLQSIQTTDGENPVQLFVTSHSPNFASIADLDSLICVFETEKGIETFFPRDIHFEKGKREKLKRYLDVSRAELFFAKKIIFVEGTAELILVSVLAEKLGFKLREHGVSLISVEGLNFDSFLPLFGEKALKMPVSLITDADPRTIDSDGNELSGIYPIESDEIQVSDNTSKMKEREDAFVKVFHGLKTFEYDLALQENNRPLMLKALKELHPKIGANLEVAVNAATSNSEKARILFTGMFERAQNNVQKGSYAQTLAQIFSEEKTCSVPEYISQAIKHVCGKLEEL